MRIDRGHLPWLIFVLLATLGAACLYVANFHPQQLPGWVGLPKFFGPVPPVRRSIGGTPLGLIFGTTAFLIFIFASALGVRKKRRLWPMGRVELWLKAHLWLTVFTLPLVLFHSGFRAGGSHTQWLLILYGTVMASGFFGAVLQHFMPRMIKERLRREVVFEEIPHLKKVLLKSTQTLRDEMEEFAAGPSESSRSGGLAIAGGTRSTVVTASAADRESAQVIIRFLDDQCLPYLAAARTARHRLGDGASAMETFRMLRLSVAERWRAQVETLERRCEERRLMDLQTKLQHWLHGWLLIHVPTSFALLIFTAWHAWVAIRFLGFLQ